MCVCVHVWSVNKKSRSTYTVVFPDVAADVEEQLVANLNVVVNRAHLTGHMAATQQT